MYLAFNFSESRYCGSLRQRVDFDFRLCCHVDKTSIIRSIGGKTLLHLENELY